MKGIGSWQDLRLYGIDVLTGEACDVSFRLLCDVTTKGKTILEKCLGCRLELNEPWNGGTEDDPHVGSIMLAPHFLIPIGIFALLESGCREVWHVCESLVGIEDAAADEEVSRLRSFHGKDIRRTYSYHGTADDRNKHVKRDRTK